jgi:hypothetical protein
VGNRVFSLCLTFGILGASLPLDAAPIHQWSKQFGAATDQLGNSVATDGSYNIIVTGELNGTADFGGGPLTSAGGADVFVAKFDINGAHLWSKRFGSTLNQIGYSVATNASGDIVLTGELNGTADFGGGPLTSAGGVDIFVAKFDAGGNHIWSKRFGDGSAQGGTSAAMDGAGNVIIEGELNGTADFGGGPLTSAGGVDIFVAKFDAAGNHLWSKRYGAASDQLCNSIDVDGSDNIFVTGELNGTTDFGGGPLTSAGSTDVFVVKIDANGNHIWSRRFGAALAQISNAVSADGAGNVAFVGELHGTMDFGGGPLTSAGGADIFVAKLDANGNHIWSKRFGGGGNQTGFSVVGYGSGGVAITGQFGGSTDFGGGPLTSAGGQDAFLVKLDAGGNHVWSLQFGDPNTEVGYSVAVDGWGDVVFTGRFAGVINFGGSPLSSAGGFDAFLTKFVDENLVPVLFTRFEANGRDGKIEVSWDVSSDEALTHFTLYRRDDAHPQAIALAQGSIDPMTRSYLDTRVAPGQTYQYELVVETQSGDEFRSPVATVTLAHGVAELGQNFPNPFNPATTIEYTVTEQTRLALDIYDVTGKLVVRLDQGVRNAGSYRVKWEGRDTSGRPVASGVYFYRLEGAPRLGVRKMILVK